MLTEPNLTAIIGKDRAPPNEKWSELTADRVKLSDVHVNRRILFGDIVEFGGRTFDFMFCLCFQILFLV